MNNVVLMGRLVADAELKKGENGVKRAEYTLAVNGYKKDEADFIRIIAFDKSAEFAEQYFKKGMRVVISGRIKTGSYTNKQGQKVYTTDVISNTQEFACDKKEDIDIPFK